MKRVVQNRLIGIFLGGRLSDELISKCLQGVITPRVPLLTIAMPVFNGGVHLRLAVLSLVRQTFSDWELLLIDDGSTDGAVGKITEFSDDRIRIIQDGQNKGLSARLNEAIDLARGYYFSRMDADDISHSERFSRQVAFLQSNSSIDLVGSRCLTISENNSILGFLPFAETHQEICARSWLGFYFPHPTWVGKLEWFKRFRYAEPAPYCCEDQELLLRSHSVSRFYALPAILLAYRLRNHINWGKARRTRSTLYRIQLRYFLVNKNYLFAGLATVAVFLRVVRDSLSWLRQFALCEATMPSAGSSIEEDEAEGWRRWIGSLEDSSG